MRRSLALSAIGVTTLLTTNCALPPGVTWNEVQQRGYITVLIDAKAQEDGLVAANTKPSEQGAVKVQAVSTAEIVRTPYAEAIPGRPGFVFSPHTAPRKPVDVHTYAQGEEVRCPYTMQPFLVPDFNAVAAASKPEPVRSKPKRTQVVSNSSAAELRALERKRARSESSEPKPVRESAPVIVDVTPEMKPAPAPAPAAPSPTVAVETPRPEAPAGREALAYGKRVAGRPGFVYSPYAAKSQLVDVAGTAPGVVVKCPYTNKMFRVPEMVTEDVAPAPSKPAAPTVAPSAPTPPAPAPEAPQPAPGKVDGDFATPQR